MAVRLEDPRRGRSGSGTIGTLENKANSALMYSHASHILAPMLIFPVFGNGTELDNMS